MSVLFAAPMPTNKLLEIELLFLFKKKKEIELLEAEIRRGATYIVYYQ